MLTDLTADMILSPTNFRRIVIGMVYQARQKQDQHMAGEVRQTPTQSLERTDTFKEKQSEICKFCLGENY